MATATNGHPAVPAEEHKNGNIAPSSDSKDEPQTSRCVDETGHPVPEHAWPRNLQNVGMHSAEPLNEFAAKMGSESFMPVSMDKECEKAARILRSFCKDGVYHDPEHRAFHEPGADASPHTPSKHHVILTIPSKVISGAVGLAIFTTARAGFHISGAAGSGILVARLPDGSWSPPSGIQIHTLGAGFLIGVEIFDCVCVINTHEALEAFMKTRVSLGPELSIAAGPFGVGGRMDFTVPPAHATPQQPHGHSKHPVHHPEPQKTPAGGADTLPPAEDTLSSKKPHGLTLSPLHEALKKPVYSYVNSRGFYAGVQVDGTIITERKEDNAAFYGESIPVEKILAGQVPTRGPPGMWPEGARVLLEVLKGATAWHGNRVAEGSDLESGDMHVWDPKDGPKPVAAAHGE